MSKQRLRFTTMPHGTTHIILDGDNLGAIFPAHQLKHRRHESWNVVLNKISTFHATLESAQNYVWQSLGFIEPEQISQ